MTERAMIMVIMEDMGAVTMAAAAEEEAITVRGTMIPTPMMTMATGDLQQDEGEVQEAVVVEVREVEQKLARLVVELQHEAGEVEVVDMHLVLQETFRSTTTMTKTMMGLPGVVSEVQALLHTPAFSHTEHYFSQPPFAVVKTRLRRGRFSRMDPTQEENFGVVKSHGTTHAASSNGQMITVVDLLMAVVEDEQQAREPRIMVTMLTRIKLDPRREQLLKWCVRFITVGHPPLCSRT